MRRFVFLLGIVVAEAAEDRIPVMRAQRYIWLPLGDGISIQQGRLVCTAKAPQPGSGLLNLIVGSTRWGGVPGAATVQAVYRNGLLQRAGLDYTLNATNEVVPDEPYPWSADDIVQAHWTGGPSTPITTPLAASAPAAAPIPTRVVRLP